MKACLGCGTTERPMMIWRGQDYCSEGCRKKVEEAEVVEDKGDSTTPTPPGYRPSWSDRPPRPLLVGEPGYRPSWSPRPTPLPAGEAGYWESSGIQGESRRFWFHQPCKKFAYDVTVAGDEVQWFQCPQCGTQKSGRRIDHEAGDHDE